MLKALVDLGAAADVRAAAALIEDAQVYLDGLLVISADFPVEMYRGARLSVAGQEYRL